MGQVPFGFDKVPHPTVTGRFLVQRNAMHPVRVRICTGDLAKLTVNEAARRLTREDIPSPGAGKQFRKTDPATGTVREWT